MNDLKTDKLKRKRFSKLKYNRNEKEPVTHKTVTETKLIFETEISLFSSLDQQTTKVAGTVLVI